MSWLEQLLWPRTRRVLSNIELDVAALRVAGLEQKTISNTVLKELRAMGAREDAAYEKLAADIQTVKDGWGSLVAERDALKAALESADADAAAQVQAALDADSEVDAAKVEAADAALADLVAPPVVEEPPVDEPPAA
jgi:hypothetical protein